MYVDGGFWVYIEVEGGRKAVGDLSVQGAKNAVLPMIAGTLLCRETVILERCPGIHDVDAMTAILADIGAEVKWEGDSLVINAAPVDRCAITGKEAGEVRASVLFLGGMLGRCGQAEICLPGGCSIGERPIDFHRKAFEKMGIVSTVENGTISCVREQAGSGMVCLPYPSVGATENVVLYAVLREGETVLRNAAKEPEIVELCHFLRSMGADIAGDGGDTIRIRGVKCLHGTTYCLKSDRIVFLTYAAMAAASGGDVCFRVCGDTFRYEQEYMRRAGCLVRETGNACAPKHGIPPFYEIRVSNRDGIRAIPYIRTGPYPSFPTDAQSLFLALLSKAYGESVLEESVFENRFRVASQLRKMGADIEVAGQRACIRGVTRLHGETVRALDLRSGAALMVAGAMSDGVTRIEDSHLILRGYEKPVEQMRRLGILARDGIAATCGREE